MVGEELMVILGTALVVISMLIIPFYVVINILMSSWDGSDKSKQYKD